MDITYFLKALLKKKWWLVLSAVAAVCIAFVLTMLKPRLYVSVSQISTGFTTSDQVRLREENLNLMEADVKFDNVVQTINSPLVISFLSCNLLLHDLTSNKPFIHLKNADRESKAFREFNREAALRICKEKLDSLTILSSYHPEERKIMEFLKLYKYDVESIRKMLYVGRLQKTDYIDIIYRSENPELSAYVVNTLFKEFLRYYRSSRSERSIENVETFEALVNQKKMELDTKLEALRMYKSSQGVLNVDVASGNEWDLIKQFEKSLFDEKSNNNTLQSSLANVNAQLVELNSGKTVYSSNNNVVTLRNQLNDLNDQYLRGGSSDQALADKIKTLRGQLQKALAEGTGTTSKSTSKEELIARKQNLQAELSASNLNISNLESKISRLRSSVGSFANKEATVSSLTQEVTLAQEEYTKLKERLNSALDNRTVPQDGFRQTLKGQPAFKPEPSHRLIIMGLSGVSAFMLVAMCILLVEFLDSSIKSPSVFGRSVDLKLISTVNHANLRKHAVLDVLQGNRKDETIMKRENIFREMLRKLRYALESSGKQVFLFTSTEPQQGKTTLTQAVAYSLSLSNRKVLVIDTNFCNNDITLQMEARPMLETFNVPPNEFSIDKVKEIVTTYSVDNIEVIGCKGGDYTPSEILPKNHLLNYLPQLKLHYDFILMEGAPLNDYTDSKELAAYADGVIAIFSSKATVKQIDKDSIDFLHQLGDKFVGAVLNNVNEDFLEL
ncbi:hypothetical protein EGT74_15040 [Chitinophaga lutea]|uniref:Polysaccharide chain length determinant N-terminal domain-containing protein n=1 Tax=Chitinophaga lutea TaxID=2488634 RepID=A0A3N4PKN1_9BACT|nr:hypothetical protein EGT74_15040 [Chitinophaga lutea]